jgi:hypothetical protein
MDDLAVALLNPSVAQASIISAVAAAKQREQVLS